jgi:hypothetical protein
MSKDIFKKTAFSVVEDNKGLVRDNYSKAIINTDENQRLEFRKKRRLLKEKMNHIKELNKEQEEKITSLEKEVENLKTMVYKILEEK